MLKLILEDNSLRSRLSNASERHVVNLIEQLTIPGSPKGKVVVYR